MSDSAVGVARGVTDEDLADFNGAWAGPQDAAALIAECDRTVTSKRMAPP
jgi:hypothetical protein